MIDTQRYIHKHILEGNLGLGLDVGMTYHVTPQLEFTASILDLGFIRHSKNARTYSVKGITYSMESTLSMTQKTQEITGQELEQDFDEKVPSDDSVGPILVEVYRINTALKYSFGEPRSGACYAIPPKNIITTQ